MISAALQKLRYRPGMKVAVLGAPLGFELELVRVRGLTRAPELELGLDLVQGFYTRRAQLGRDLPRVAATLGPRTVAWVCYPKARALGTDLDRDLVRRIVSPFHLEVVGIAAIDDTWTALRIRLA